MVRLISIIYVVLLSWWQTEEAIGVPLINATKAISLGLQIYEEARKFRELIKLEKCNDTEPNEEEVSVLTGLNTLDNQIAEPTQLSTIIAGDSLEDFYKKIRNIQEIVHYVNRTHNKFLDLTKSTDCIKKSNLKELLVDSFWDSKNTDLKTLIAEMHNNFTKPSAVNTDSLLTGIYNDKTQLMCTKMQSAQETLSQIYNSIVITDLKALTLQLITSDKFEENTGKSEELDLESFKNRTSELYSNTSEYILRASRNLWKCDPDNFVEGKSYSKLQQIFQAIILKEEDTTANTCLYSGCDEMYKTGEKVKYWPNSNLSKQENPKLHCDGYIADCWDTSEYLSYCAAPENDNRRYAGMKYGGKIYGESFNKSNCEDRYNRIVAYTNGFHYCDSCLCTCASTKVEVDRYFTLKEVTSNTDKGMVVTGVHVRLINHVFYIDIREGRLGKNGIIEPGSTNWRNTSSEEKVNFKQIMADKSSEFEILHPNKEVYAVHWGQKTVFLDDIEDESGDFVLTGLRFAQQKDALKLEVRLNPFEYETGLISSEHVWRGNEQTVESRERVPLVNADNPVKKIKGKKGPKNTYISPTGTFLEFTTTSREKDLGQFTIPFMDTQEVAPEPPVLLSGAGFYHKGLPMGECGGFLGLKLIQYNTGKHSK